MTRTGSTSKTPVSGAAGGELTGTYPNPTVKSGVNLTGVPTAATAAVDTNTMQLATCAFDLAQVAAAIAIHQKIMIDEGAIPQSTAAGKYWLDGQNVIATTASLASAQTVLPIRSADYPNVAGKAAKIRIRSRLQTNGTAPGRSITVALYPITPNGGGSGSVLATLGTVVASSTVTHTTVALSTTDVQTSAWLTLPADGEYALVAEVLTGTTAALSTEVITAEVQLHYE